MANGSFSAQLQQAQAQQVPSRISRTQRVQATEQEERAKYNFGQLQKEAERLKSTEFSNISFEDYKLKYAKLSSDMQQFFLSPQEITAQQEIKSQEQKTQLQNNIDQIRIRIENTIKSRQDYLKWWQEISDYSRNQQRENYSRRMEEYNRDLDEYEETISYAQGEAGKIDAGATASDIWNYAQDKADYNRERREAKGRAIKEFNESVKTGKLDQDLLKLGLSKTATYEQFASKVESYNKDVAYMQQLQKWSSKVGFENLPQWTKEKLNPTAMQWQSKYPTEQLQFDKSGNVISVKSGTLGRTYAITEYDKKVLEYQDYSKKLEADYEKQTKLQTEAQTYLKEKGFGEGISFVPPKQNILSTIWSGLKTGYLSSLFGTDFSLSKSKQKEITALREQNVIEAITPKFNLIGTPTVLDLTKFSTIPLKTSWEAVQTQRQLDYEGKQAGKLMEQLNVYSKGGAETNFNLELKPYIEAEGWKIIREKGVEMTETKGWDFAKADKYGNIPETTTIKITDPSFERRMSQNLLELESEFSKRKTQKENVFANLVPQTFPELMLETKIVSSEMLKTKGLFEGIKLTATGIGLGYKALGLPTIQFYRTIQMEEGIAKVPMTFKTVKTAGAFALTGLYAYGKYQQYQSYKQTSAIAGKELFLLETTGELAGIEWATHIGERTFNKALNRIENFNLKTVKQADLSQKGFMRENKVLGTQEKVYMERYKGFKLSKPKSWLQTLQGYEKGEFTGRVYKQIPDEVLAYYKYQGDVFIYDKTGTQLKKIIKAEPFPYDTTKTHMEWFMKKNIQEYGLPSKSKLPIDVKGKAFGYSATGEEWVGTEFKPNEITYMKDGVLKTLHLKGALQYVSGKGVSAGFLRVFSRGAYERGVGKTATKPIIYADYFDKVQMNKAIKEIRTLDASGRELKAYIYSKDTGATGTLNIGQLKREVEGTVEIETRIPIRKAFALKLEGWKIPIEEQIFTSKEMLSTSEIKGIIKNMGSLKELKGVAYSSLPSSTSSLNKAIYSIIGSSKPSSAYKSSMSKISSVSKMSDISRVSSAVSKASGVSEVSASRVSRISDILRKSSGFSMSKISSYVSITKSPPPSRIFRTPRLEGLYGEVKKRRKFRITPEIQGLFPDFTARAIGLAPKQVSLKQAMREIAKLQTGFEIRTGARIKGYKPIDERNLMRGIMA